MFCVKSARYSAVIYSDNEHLLHIFACNMTQSIQENPCFGNSDIEEISGDFLIAYDSQASRGTFIYSRSKPTVLQELCPT